MLQVDLLIYIPTIVFTNSLSSSSHQCCLESFNNRHPKNSDMMPHGGLICISLIRDALSSHVHLSHLYVFF